MTRTQSPCNIRTTNVLCVATARYNRFSAEGDSLATFGTMVNGRHYTMPVENSFIYSAMDRYPQGYWAQHGSRFYHTDAERAEIRVYGFTGALERIIRVDHERPHATKASFTYTRDRRESSPEEQHRADLVRAVDESAPVPERLPAHRRFLVDRTGQLWLREYPEMRQGPAPRWFVFDTAGDCDTRCACPSRCLRSWDCVKPGWMRSGRTTC